MRFSRWRRRQGIAAPALVIRPRRGARERLAIALAVLSLLALAFLAGWELALAGSGQNSAVRQCATLAAENERLQSLVTASESDLRIERAAQQKLAEENARLTSELARLREELSVLQRLSSQSPQAKTVAVPTRGANVRGK